MATRIATNTSSTDFIDEWESYFSYLTSDLNECRRHRETDSVEKVSYFCETLERFIVSTDRLLVTANDAVQCPSEYNDVNVSDCLMLAELLERLVHSLRDSLAYWRSRDEQLQSTAAIPHAGEFYRYLEFDHAGASVLYIYIYIYLFIILHCIM